MHIIGAKSIQIKWIGWMKNMEVRSGCSFSIGSPCGPAGAPPNWCTHLTPVLLAVTGVLSLENNPQPRGAASLRRPHIPSRGSQWLTDTGTAQATPFASKGALWWNSYSRFPCGIRLKLDTISASTILLTSFICPILLPSLPLIEEPSLNLDCTNPNPLFSLWFQRIWFKTIPGFHWSSLSSRAFYQDSWTTYYYFSHIMWQIMYSIHFRNFTYATR